MHLILITLLGDNEVFWKKIFFTTDAVKIWEFLWVIANWILFLTTSLVAIAVASLPKKGMIKGLSLVSTANRLKAFSIVLSVLSDAKCNLIKLKWGIMKPVALKNNQLLTKWNFINKIVSSLGK